MVRVILRVVGPGEDVVTVAPCHFAGADAAAVLIITNRRLHLADQAKPGHVYQNLSWLLSDIAQVSLRPPGPLSFFKAELEVAVSNGRQRVSKLDPDQAERILSDLTTAQEWFRQARRQGGSGDQPAGGFAFICYARVDDAEVGWLQRVLADAGVPVWRDTDQLSAGQNWELETRRAISGGAKVFIACFSRASTARSRGYQYEELLLAAEEMRLRRPGSPWFIPVRFDDCQIPDLGFGPGSGGSIQRADLFGPDREQQAALLAETVLRMLSASG